MMGPFSPRHCTPPPRARQARPFLPCPAFALEKPGRVEVEQGRPPEIQFSLALSDFVHNTSFRARPDNTGIVKYRYLGHLEIQPHWSPVALVLDTNFFTDRDARNEF